MLSSIYFSVPLSLLLIFVTLLGSLFLQGQGVYGQAGVDIATCSQSSHQSTLLSTAGFSTSNPSRLLTSGALSFTTNTTVYGLVLHNGWDAAVVQPCETAHVRLGLYLANGTNNRVLTLLDQTADYIVPFSPGDGYLYFPTVNAVKTVLTPGFFYQVALATDSQDMKVYCNGSFDPSFTLDPSNTASPYDYTSAQYQLPTSIPPLFASFDIAADVISCPLTTGSPIPAGPAFCSSSSPSSSSGLAPLPSASSSSSTVLSGSSSTVSLFGSTSSVASSTTLSPSSSSAQVVAVDPGAQVYAFPDASNPATSSYTFNNVNGVAVDGAGNIYVADFFTGDNGGTGRVVVLSSTGVLLYAFPNASNPIASSYTFHEVNGVAVDSAGNIYVADFGTGVNSGIGRVVVLSSTGALLYAFPDASDPATSGYTFNHVSGVAVDGAGNIYVADEDTVDNGGIGRVVVLSSTGELLNTFPDTSNPATSSYYFNYVYGVAVDSAGNIYVADWQTITNGGNGRVVVLSSTGVLLNVFPDASNPFTNNYYFENVFGVAVDNAGNIYVADYLTSDNGGSGRVVVLSSTGVLLQAFPNASNPTTSSYTFDNVNGVAVDSAGNIYVADENTVDNGGIGRVVVLAGLNSSSASVFASSSTGSQDITGISIASSSSSSVVSPSSSTIESPSTASSATPSSSTSSSIVSSSATSPSVAVSASSSVASATAASTGGRGASVVGDPLFVGLRGQRYQIHGVSGQVYNLIVDSAATANAMRINARFVFLSSGRCPLVALAGTCWSHPGSYLQEVGVWTAGGDKLTIRSGNYQQGYANVTLNGITLQPDTVIHNGTSISLLFPSQFVVQLTVGNFYIEMHNSDHFINLNTVAVKQWSQLTNTHGLLGQTWRLRQPKGKEVKEVEGYVDEYAEQSNDVLGEHFVYHGTE